MFDLHKFIEAVRDRPALYDSAHRDYYWKRGRLQLWDEIGGIMYPEWDSWPVLNRTRKSTFMRLKWKSLRDSYNREVKSRKKNNSVNKFRKKYDLHDELSFLHKKHNLEPPSTPLPKTKEVRVRIERLRNLKTYCRTSINTECQTVNENPVVTSKVPSERVNQNPRLEIQESKEGPAEAKELPDPRIKTESEENLDSSDGADEFQQQQQQNTPSETKHQSRHKVTTGVRVSKSVNLKTRECKKVNDVEDGDRLFFMSFVSDFKRLPWSTKYWVKMKFSEMMHQAAMSIEEFEGTEGLNIEEEEGEEAYQM